MEQVKRPRTEVDKSIFKIIAFYERIENSVELLVRLKNDGFNGARFFRSVIEAYLNELPTRRIRCAGTAARAPPRVFRRAAGPTCRQCARAEPSRIPALFRRRVPPIACESTRA